MLPSVSLNHDDLIGPGEKMLVSGSKPSISYVSNTTPLDFRASTSASRSSTVHPATVCWAEPAPALLGMSPDDEESHRKFAAKFNLPFQLLADPGAKIATEYGVWKEKNNYGRTYMGVERTTFILDRSGVIRKIFPRVKIDGHVPQVLEALNSLK